MRTAIRGLTACVTGGAALVLLTACGGGTTKDAAATSSSSTTPAATAAPAQVTLPVVNGQEVMPANPLPPSTLPANYVSVADLNNYGQLADTMWLDPNGTDAQPNFATVLGIGMSICSMWHNGEGSSAIESKLAAVYGATNANSFLASARFLCLRDYKG